jgi:protein-disulfide isomerase
VHRYLLSVTTGALLLVATALAQQPSSGGATSTGGIREEIEALRKEIGDLRRDVNELRQGANQRPDTSVRTAGRAVVPVAGAPTMGRADAPVTVVEFSDYQCPFCRRHVMSTFPELKKEYLDTGKVRYVYRDYPIDRIHPEARKAAEAARCAGDQNKYWEMHDALFAKQRQLAPEQLKTHAAALVLDQAAFDVCLDHGKHSRAVGEEEELAASLGVTGTPTFFIGRTTSDGRIDGSRLVGAQPIGVFRRAIDKLLDGAN